MDTPLPESEPLKAADIARLRTLAGDHADNARRYERYHADDTSARRPSAWSDRADEAHAIASAITALLSAADRLVEAEKALEEARDAIEPFQRLNFPTLVDADDEEGDIPDNAEIEATVAGYRVDLNDWMDGDALKVGEYRALFALARTLKRFFASHSQETT